MSVPRSELSWFRSSRCADVTCAEVAGDAEHIYIRDGKSPCGPVLKFTRAEWEAFRDGLKLGDFDSV
jgi:hypothetical protein